MVRKRFVDKKRKIVTDKLSQDADVKKPYSFTSSIEEQANLYGLAFNPYIDSTSSVEYFATCGGKFVTLFRIEEGNEKLEEVRRFGDPVRTEDYYSLSWAVDTEDRVHVIAVGGENAIVRILDPQTGATRNVLRGHGGAINDIRTSPANSNIIVTGSKDHTARLWNIRFAVCLASFCGVEGHRDQVLSVDIDPTQQFLLTSSMDHTIRVWDLKQYKSEMKRQKEIITNPPHWPEEFFPHAVASDVHTNYVDCARFLGSFILSKSCENEMKLFKLGGYNLPAGGVKAVSHPETYTLLTSVLNIPETEIWFNKFDVRSDNEFLACGNENGTIYLFDLPKIGNRLAGFAGKDSLAGITGPLDK